MTANELETGTFTDKRDGQVYRTVKMPDGKVWMAQNLNYKIENSWCYDNDESNGDKYGRLYTWEAAQKACPTGWHLPYDVEWESLMQAVGGTEHLSKVGVHYIYFWDVAGAKLKAGTDWKNFPGKSGCATDESKFSVVPGGFYRNGKFYRVGSLGGWWLNKNVGKDEYVYWAMDAATDLVQECWSGAEGAVSVRYVQD